jgi:hypothetical protein
MPYNLRLDISESTDLSTLFPDKSDEMYNLLKEWQKDVGAKFPRPNTAFYKTRRQEWLKHPD